MEGVVSMLVTWDVVLVMGSRRGGMSDVVRSMEMRMMGIRAISVSIGDVREEAELTLVEHFKDEEMDGSRGGWGGMSCGGESA
jgi:hypothetical protein